jgi:hypothetical protein
MTDYVIIERGSEWPWCLAKGADGAADKLQSLIAEHGFERWAGAQVMTYDDYAAQHDARYLDAPPQVITADDFEEALGCLPPMQWHTTPDGVNVFCMSEFTSGRITTQYGRRNGAYRMRSVRFGDRSTYLRAADFA